MPSIEDIVIPGDIASSSSSIKPGQGIQPNKGGDLKATLFGKKIIENKDSRLHIVSATPSQPFSRNYVPNVNDTVYAKVTKIAQNQIYLDIIMINNINLYSYNIKGILRREDISETNIDQINLYNEFSLLEIIKCKILSLGDTKYYFLTINGSGLGSVIKYDPNKYDC